MKRVACNLFPICCPSPSSTQEQTLVKPDRLLLTPTHWKYIHQPFKIQSPQIVVDESDTSRVFCILKYGQTAIQTSGKLLEASILSQIKATMR